MGRVDGGANRRRMIEMLKCNGCLVGDGGMLGGSWIFGVFRRRNKAPQLLNGI